MRLADVDDGAAFRVFDGATKDFVGKWRSVTFTEEYELEDVCDRVAFVPFEVGVRHLACGLFERNEKCCECVGDYGTSCSEYTMPADALAGDSQLFFEL